MPIGSKDNQEQSAGGDGAQPSSGARKPMSPAERARHASLVRWGKEQPFAARLEAVRERRKAAKQKKAKGKAPKKPTLTPEEKEAQAAKERAANVASVGDALNQADNETLSKNGLDGLVSAAAGQEPPANVAQGLIDSGLAVRGEDGRYRLTADGQAIVRAAESGNTNAVLDRLSAVNDKNQKEKAKEEKQGKGGGGGGGSAKPTEEEKAQQKQQKKDDNRAKIGQQLAENDADLSARGLDALSSLMSGEDVDEGMSAGLVEMGLVEQASDGTYRASVQGRAAIRAAERGDYREVIDAVSRAKDRAAQKQERDTAKKQRQADRRAREDERRQREDERRAKEDGEEGAESEPDKGRSADDRLRGRDGQQKPGRERRGPTRPGLYTKHGAHDQSSHGKRGARGRAAGGAYRSARAGGASIAEARQAANDVSTVYTNKQRVANIDKQLTGQVSDKQRASLQAERKRLEEDTQMRATRTPDAQTAAFGFDVTPAAPTVRGRQSNEQREWDATMRTRAQDAVAMRAKVDADARRTTDKAELQRLQQRRQELNQVLEGYREQGHLTQEQTRAAQRGEYVQQRPPLRAPISGDLQAEARFRQQRQEAAQLRQEQRNRDRAMREKARANIARIEKLEKELRNPRISITRLREIQSQLADIRTGKSLEIDAMIDFTPVIDDLKALCNEAQEMALEDDAEVKAGRRNNSMDQSLIDEGYALAEELCDLFEALGATVEEEIEEDAMGMEGKGVNYDQAAQLVRDAWVQQSEKGNNSTTPYPWPQAVFDDGVIISQDGCLYFVPYRREEGAIVFSPRNEWRMARQTYITQDGDVKAQRTFGGKERGDVPDEDFAGPEKTYPIMTADDVRDAARLIGKADDPEAVKKKIIAIAKRKGFTDAIPEGWETKKSMDEEDVSMVLGAEVKSIGGDRIRGLAIRFGDVDEPDMSYTRDFFTAKTAYWLDAWERRPMLYHHALEENTADDPVIGTWTKAAITDEGVWLEGELSKSFKYQAAIKELIRRGVLRISTDSAPHLVRRAMKSGGIHEVTRWPIVCASLTVSPAEPRLSGVSFKSLIEELGLSPSDDNKSAAIELELIAIEQEEALIAGMAE